jgi:polyisoprenyl-teichoic acid--peptidoglycan teichoic acid transferase
MRDVGLDGTVDVVDEAVGIRADYVLLAGFDAFRDLVHTIGGVDVRVDDGFYDESLDLRVRPGLNSFDDAEALDFTRSRKEFGAGDFVRSANQQALMGGILAKLLAHEDDAGFMERGAAAALVGLATDLSPVEVYRLAQAVTRVRPGRVTTCVLPGTPGETVVGASIVTLRERDVRRIAADVAEDMSVDRC